MDKLRACVNLYFDGLAEQKIAIDRNEFLMLVSAPQTTDSIAVEYSPAQP